MGDVDGPVGLATPPRASRVSTATVSPPGAPAVTEAAAAGWPGRLTLAVGAPDPAESSAGAALTPVATFGPAAPVAGSPVAAPGAVTLVVAAPIVVALVVPAAVVGTAGNAAAAIAPDARAVTPASAEAPAAVSATGAVPSAASAGGSDRAPVAVDVESAGSLVASPAAAGER
jgi:hypothetical protein